MCCRSDQQRTVILLAGLALKKIRVTGDKALYAYVCICNMIFETPHEGNLVIIIVMVQVASVVYQGCCVRAHSLSLFLEWKNPV